MQQSKISPLLLVALLWLVPGIASAQLQKLYSTDLEPGRSSLLYELDSETGEVLRTIGDTGERILAITGSREDLIAITAPDSATANSVIRIDTSTAGSSLIKPLPAGIESPVVDISATELAYGLVLVQQDGMRAISSLSTPPPHTRPEPWSANSFNTSPVFPGLYGFVSGSPRLIGSQPGLLGSILLGCSLDDDSSELSVFSQTLNAVGIIADPPIPVPPPVVFDLPDQTCFSAADRSIHFELLAIAVARDLGATRELVSANIETGAISTLGSLPDFAHGLAFGNGSPLQVPALHPSGLMLLALMVLAVVVFRLHQARGIQKK